MSDTNPGLARLHPAYLTSMVAAYLACAAWSSIDVPIGAGPDAEPVPLDSLGATWAPDAVAAAWEVCTAFVETAGAEMRTLDIGPDAAGHDLWLTAAHHGAGFWDRGYGSVGDRLTQVAHTFPMDAYVGDDGALHLS